MKTSSAQGIYLYCIADGSKNTSLGNIGIEDSEVCALAYRDISAIVHNCQAHPYESEDADEVKNWVITHQDVVDRAWHMFGTVLPLVFDTIIIGDEGADPKENMIKWLQKDYEKLREKLNKVKGKAEYGVQVLWDPEVIVELIARDTPEIADLREQLKSKPPGTAYMYEQKMKNLLRGEMEKKADEYFNEFYARIKKEVLDVSIGKVRKGEDNLQMLMNLSCMVVTGGVKKLGLILEEIENEKGFVVRFTGPWPLYSFV